MIKRNVVNLLAIITSVIIALCAGIFAWKTLALIYPHKSVLEFSLGAIEPDYDLSRWAVGSIMFGLLYLSLSYLRDKSLTRQSLEKIEPDLTLKPLWIGVFSLRIVFSLFLVSFWSNYVFYIWFSNISLVIGGFGNDLLVRQGSIIVPSLLGVYIIVIEPWKKLISISSSRFLGTAGRIFSIIFISINFYLLSVTGYPGYINIPILIDLFFLIAFVIMMVTLKGRATNKDRSSET